MNAADSPELAHPPEVRVVKALSIRQPWAELIACGRKRIENRTRPFSYRGPLLIHASLGSDPRDWTAVRDRYGITLDPALPRGGFVAVAELVDVVTASDDPYFVGPHGLLLVNTRRLPHFVRARGALGLWCPPAGVLAALNAEMPVG